MPSTKVKHSTPWGIGLPSLIRLTRGFRGRNTIVVSEEHQKAIQQGDEVQIVPAFIVTFRRGSRVTAKLLVPENNFV